jgi:hypothetical protein
MMSHHSEGATAMFSMAAFTQCRLPAQVFVDTSGTFLFFEFARAFGDGAWRLFTRLAREFGESVVRCRCLDPDAELYYRANFGEAAQFSFAANGAAEAYVGQLHDWPPESIADAVAYRGDVVAWAGDSGRWACWGERASGLCVLRIAAPDRLRKELVALSDDYVPVLTLSEALSDVVSSEMTAEALEGFGERMRHCYS